VPWTVRLQDDHCKPVSPEYAVIQSETIPSSGNFKLLRYVDPYGDTYFNRVQMEDFLADWNRPQPSSDQREQWELVRTMALRCRDKVHLYLLFWGD
jgi:hypothetical protein